MKQEKLEEVAVKILDDLRLRCGFDDLIGNLDEEIKDEIILDIAKLLSENIHLNQNKTLHLRFVRACGSY